MIDAQPCRAIIPASVKRLGKGRWEAWIALAGSHGVTGSGETDKAARADLERNLAWAAHYVGAFVALDGSGAPWVCTVASWHGAWTVRRVTAEGWSTGSTTVNAPTYSALCRDLATWNAPTPEARERAEGARVARTEMTSIPQTRWGPCVHCKAEGWWTPSTHVGANPLHEHDRPQGGRCGAAKAVEERAAGVADAKEEIRRDGWTQITARAWLVTATGPETTPYGAGFRAEVERFARLPAKRG